MFGNFFIELFFMAVPFAFVNGPWWVVLIAIIVSSVLELNAQHLPDFIAGIVLFGPWVWAFISTVTSPQTIWSFVFYIIALIWIIRIIRFRFLLNDFKNIVKDYDDIDKDYDNIAKDYDNYDE